MRAVLHDGPPAGSFAARDAAPSLRDRDFARFRELVDQAAGIAMPEAKRALLAGRLGRRVRELGLAGFGEYYERVTGDLSGAELVRMLDLVTTNETSFFREPRHFDFLAERLVPAWRDAAARGERARTVRVWSAACSTGPEPYSIAMVLLDRLPIADGWRVEVLGTDLSTRALRVAREGAWPVKVASQVPAAYRERFMRMGTGEQGEVIRATPELRAAVQFARLNLHQPRWPASGTFDLILCRNVLIYFSADGARRVVQRLAERLAPGGVLMVGHAESLQGSIAGLRGVAPATYVRT